MFQANPMQFIGMIRQGYNPQQLMLNFLETNMKGTPMGDNLLNLVRTGQTGQIEVIARNLMTQRGVDFDKDFMNFKKSLGL